MFSAKSHFNICRKIYSQTDLEMSRVELQAKYLKGRIHCFELAGFRVIGVRVIGVKITVNI